MRKLHSDLTTLLLSEEFTHWNAHPDNLRFGQYIYSVYGLGGPWPELFYERNPHEAYSIILSHLYECEIEEEDRHHEETYEDRLDYLGESPDF